MSRKTLDTLTFDNRFTRELPADPESTNQRRQVIRACYSRVLPQQLQQPTMVACAREVVHDLELTMESSAICSGFGVSRRANNSKLLTILAAR